MAYTVCKTTVFKTDAVAERYSVKKLFQIISKINNQTPGMDPVHYLEGLTTTLLIYSTDYTTESNYWTNY